jgi:hypothetical protein
MFAVLADKHLEGMKNKFESKLTKLVKGVESVIWSNGGSNALTPVQKVLESIEDLRSKLKNGYESLIKPNNNDLIKWEKYPLETGDIKLYRYADQVGRGFSIRSDFQILRSIFL